MLASHLFEIVNQIQKDFQSRPSWVYLIWRPKLVKSQHSAEIVEIGNSVILSSNLFFSYHLQYIQLFCMCACVFVWHQLQHISSRRHKDRAAGKPAKPKFSPYTPTQRHQSFQSVSILLYLKPMLVIVKSSCRILCEMLKSWFCCTQDSRQTVCQQTSPLIFNLSSDLSSSTKDPGPDQTSGLMSHTASTLCCCCHAVTALLPSLPCLKFKPHPVSVSAPPPAAPAPVSWTHLFNTYTGSVFPLLTLSNSQWALNYS